MQACLNDGAAAADCLDAGIQGAFIANTLDGDVDAYVLFGLVLDERNTIPGFGIVDSSANAPALDRLSSRRIWLGNEDLGRAGSMRTQDSQRTDWAGSGDQDSAARLDSAAIHGIQGDSGWLDHRRFFIADRIRHLGGVVVIDDRELRHAAPCPAQSHTAHFLAEMIEASATVIVVHRHDERLNRNAVAAPEACDVLADLQDFGGEFVTKNLGECRGSEDMGRRRRDDRAGDVLVQVRSANARPQRFDQQLVWTEAFWLLDVFDADVLAAVVSNSFHRRELPSDLSTCPRGRGCRCAACRETDSDL